MGLLEILFIVFVVLKLTHNIDWSWWAVFAPLLISAGLYVVWGFVLALISLIAYFGGKDL